MRFPERVFRIICDAPGIPVEAIHERLAAGRSRFIAIWYRLRLPVSLWHLEDDGQVTWIAEKQGRRHYFAADRGRFTDHPH